MRGNPVPRYRVTFAASGEHLPRMIYRVTMDTQEALPSGTEVILLEATFGYEPGAVGVVVRSNPETILVRFERTGHTVPVARDLLRVA